MASRDIRNIKEYLICAICLEPLRDPRRLPCDHSFCLICLVGHINECRGRWINIRSFLCPSCKISTAVTNPGDSNEQIAEGFPSNAFLADIESKLRVHESAVCVCKNHNEKPAEYICVPDATLLCPDCAVATHRSIKCQVISISKANTLIDKEIEELQQICNEKKRELENMLTSEYQTKYLENVKKNTIKEIEDFEKRIGKLFERVYQDIDTLKNILKDVSLPMNYKCKVDEEIRNITGLKDELQNLKEKDEKISLVGEWRDIRNKNHLQLSRVNHTLDSLSLSIFVKNPKIEELLSSRGNVVGNISGKSKAANRATPLKPSHALYPVCRRRRSNFQNINEF